MTVTNLSQVVPTRLLQGVRTKLLRACCHQLANNLLRADLLKQLVANLPASSTLLQDYNNLFQTCNSLEQAVNTCNKLDALSHLLQGCSNKSDTVMI